jgi:hypothetical protein
MYVCMRACVRERKREREKRERERQRERETESIPKKKGGAHPIKKKKSNNIILGY